MPKEPPKTIQQYRVETFNDPSLTPETVEVEGLFQANKRLKSKQSYVSKTRLSTKQPEPYIDRPIQKRHSHLWADICHCSPKGSICFSYVAHPVILSSVCSLAICCQTRPPICLHRKLGVLCPSRGRLLYLLHKKSSNSL